MRSPNSVYLSQRGPRTVTAWHSLRVAVQHLGLTLRNFVVDEVLVTAQALANLIPLMGCR